MGWTGPIHLPSSCWSADSSALYPKKHTAADLMTRPQSQSLICVLRCSGTKYTNEQPSSCLHMMFVMAKLWLITKPHSGSDLAGHIPPGFSIITHMSVEASWYSRVQPLSGSQPWFFHTTPTSLESAHGGLHLCFQNTTSMSVPAGEWWHIKTLVQSELLITVIL